MRFGDGGSCFLTNDSTAIDTLQAYDAKALRFWRGNDGYARSWLLESPTDGLWVIFNSYGIELPIQARVLASHLSCAYQEVTVSGNAVTFNNGRVVLLGDADAVQPFAKGKDKRYKTIELAMHQQFFNCSVTGKRYPMSEAMLTAEGYHVHKDTKVPVCDGCGRPVMPGSLRGLKGKKLCGYCAKVAELAAGNWVVKRRESRRMVLA